MLGFIYIPYRDIDQKLRNIKGSLFITSLLFFLPGERSSTFEIGQGYCSVLKTSGKAGKARLHHWKPKAEEFYVLFREESLEFIKGKDETFQHFLLHMRAWCAVVFL